MFMVIFQCPPFSKQSQTAVCLPAAKKGLILENEAEKRTYYHQNDLDISKAFWYYLFHKEVKSWNSTKCGSGFDNFETRLKRSIFKCIFWLNFFLLNWWLRFSKRGSQNLSNLAPMSPLNSLTLLFCLHIYSIWISHCVSNRQYRDRTHCGDGLFTNSNFVSKYRVIHQFRNCLV